MVYRLRTLELISKWQYRSLNVELSTRGYRTQEPNSIQRETSQVLNKVFTGLRKEGIGRVQIGEALNIHPEDLDGLVFGLAMLPLEGAGAGGAEATPPSLRLVHG